MKPLQVVAFNAVDDSATRTSGAIDTGTCIALSIQAYFSATCAGTLKLQMSNDPVTNGAPSTGFTPTNWTDIPSATAAVTAGASVVITVSTSAYRWIRAVYTFTSGTGTITANVYGIEL